MLPWTARCYTTPCAPISRIWDEHDDFCHVVRGWIADPHRILGSVGDDHGVPHAHSRVRESCQRAYYFSGRLERDEHVCDRGIVSVSVSESRHFIAPNTISAVLVRHAARASPVTSGIGSLAPGGTIQASRINPGIAARAEVTKSAP